MFTDVANGVNFVRGPENVTYMENMTAPTLDGRITRPHPIWGTLTITIPFLPMLFYGFNLAAFGYNPWDVMSSCGELEGRDINQNICLLWFLAIPFTFVATPWYICFVIWVGCRRVIWPEAYGWLLKNRRGASFKSWEILFESS